MVYKIPPNIKFALDRSAFEYSRAKDNLSFYISYYRDYGEKANTDEFINLIDEAEEKFMQYSTIYVGSVYLITGSDRLENATISEDHTKLYVNKEAC